MKIRNFVLLTAVLAIGVTSLNFLTDSFSLSGRLPDTGGQHHLEAARREASGRGLGTRIERHPRLERELSDQAEPKADAERTRLVGRYQQNQVPAPPIQPKREAPGLPSPVALQSPPPPSPTASEQTTRYTGNPKPPPPPPAPLQLAAQPPPSLAGSQLNTTQGSSLQQQPPPSEQATAQPPPLPLVQPKQPQSTSKSPPAPSSTPVSQQQAGTDSSVTGSSSNTTSASTGASGSGAQQVVAQPPPGVIQLPTHSAATFNISESQQGSGQAEQAPPAQPGNATVTGAAKEAAQGLLSTVGQGVNATQTALAATGVLGGLAANEAVSASLPGNDSMAKGAAKALGDEGSGGTLAQSGANQAAGTGKAVNRQRYHVVASVNGNVYTAWQARVCYYWYKKAREQDTAGVMGGFTRLLHSGVPDDLMDDIPTVVVNPLPEGIDKGYVVLNRPYAFQQWAHQALPALEEDYVLMAEPDHIFLKPLPLWATPHKAAAFPFFYIEPAKNTEVIQPYVKNGFPVEQMAPIGNAPVMLHKDNLTSVVDTWYNLSLSMKQDPAAEKAFGWILEMYAFSIASTQKPGGPLTYELHKDMMIQPPWDTTLQVQGNDTYILHFTYGNDYNEQGVLTYATKTHYRFDKRDYSWHYPPLDLPMPPENVNVPSLRKLIACINEVSAATPGWAAHANAHEQA